MYQSIAILPPKHSSSGEVVAGEIDRVIHNRRGKPVCLCWIQNGLEGDSTNHNQGIEKAVLEEVF